MNNIKTIRQSYADFSVFMENGYMKSVRHVFRCGIFVASLFTAGTGGAVPADDQHPVIPGQALPGLVVSSPKLGDADFPKPSPSGRHNGKVKAVQSGDYELVMIGDSITQCIGDSGGEWEPIKAVWKKHYEPRKAINLGYSGYRTENILWTLSNGELEFKKSPKVFRILLGTNNLDDQHYPQIHSAEQVFAGTRAIVSLIRGKFPDSKILILRILPSGGSKDKTDYHRVYCRSNKAVQALRDAGAMTSALADGEHVFWLDINHVFIRPDGTINSDLMPDLIHPNAAGHEAMAQALEPELARLMGDKPIVDEPANTAVVPASKLEENGYDWLGRHNEIIKLGKQVDPEVVFIGDSITHGWGGQPVASFRHARTHTMDQVFGSIRTLNLGFGWDRTQNVLWRIDHGELDGIKPRAVVLHIGTNNTSGTKKARQNTAVEITEGIRACVMRIRAKLPDARIILMSVFPREAKPDHPRRKLIDEVNKVLAVELGNVPGITVIDLGPKLCNSDGTLSRDVSFDFCHLTDNGYQLWADALTPILAQKQ